MIKYYNNNRVDFQQNQSFAGKLFVCPSVLASNSFISLYIT